MFSIISDFENIVLIEKILIITMKICLRGSNSRWVYKTYRCFEVVMERCWFVLKEHGKPSNLSAYIWSKRILKQVGTDIVRLKNHSMSAVLKSPKNYHVQYFSHPIFSLTFVSKWDILIYISVWICDWFGSRVEWTMFRGKANLL